MDTKSAQRSVDSEREHFIPVRKIDVLNALADHGALPDAADRDKFRQFCRLLGAIYHYEYYDQLESLRDSYFYFDPESDGHSRADSATLERAYRDLIIALTGVLHDANFIEVAHEEIERAHRDDALVRVKIHASLDNYREIRFFRRGNHKETVDIRKWFGLRSREVEIHVYDDVVMLVTVKRNGSRAEKRQGHPFTQSQAPTGSRAAEILPEHRKRRPQCPVSGCPRCDEPAGSTHARRPCADRRHTDPAQACLDAHRAVPDCGFLSGCFKLGPRRGMGRRAGGAERPRRTRRFFLPAMDQVPAPDAAASEGDFRHHLFPQCEQQCRRLRLDHRRGRRSGMQGGVHRLLFPSRLQRAANRASARSAASKAGSSRHSEPISISSAAMRCRSSRGSICSGATTNGSRSCRSTRR